MSPLTWHQEGDRIFLKTDERLLATWENTRTNQRNAQAICDQVNRGSLGSTHEVSFGEPSTSAFIRTIIVVVVRADTLAPFGAEGIAYRPSDVAEIVAEDVRQRIHDIPEQGEGLYILQIGHVDREVP